MNIVQHYEAFNTVEYQYKSNLSETFQVEWITAKACHIFFTAMGTSLEHPEPVKPYTKVFFSNWPLKSGNRKISKLKNSHAEISDKENNPDSHNSCSAVSSKSSHKMNETPVALYKDFNKISSLSGTDSPSGRSLEHDALLFSKLSINNHNNKPFTPRT